MFIPTKKEDKIRKQDKDYFFFFQNAYKDRSERLPRSTICRNMCERLRIGCKLRLPPMTKRTNSLRRSNRPLPARWLDLEAIADNPWRFNDPNPPKIIVNRHWNLKFNNTQTAWNDGRETIHNDAPRKNVWNQFGMDRTINKRNQVN
jgi:hypothetical protein